MATVSSDTSRRSTLARFYPLLLVVLTLLSYLPVLSGGFIEAYDDELYPLNPALAGGISLQALRWSVATFTGGNWNPVTWWSHLIDVQLFGLNPARHHATSLVIHTANALLLYLLFARATGKRGRSLVVALLFSLHPLHVQSVAWVAERKDVLSALFGICALHAYLSFVRCRRGVVYLLVVLLYCLSLMAKPMLVTLPVLLLLFDAWPLERKDEGWWRLVREKLPLLLPALAISAVTVVAQQSEGALIPLSAAPLPTRLATALHACLTYLRLFLWPERLSFFYPARPVATRETVAAALLLAGMSAAAWHFRRREPWLLTGWGWFVAGLLPVVGIVKVGLQPYADRYTYLPLVGPAVIAVWGCCTVMGRDGEGRGRGTRWLVVPAVVAIAACGVRTWIEAGYWRDGFSLYGRALAVTEGNWLAHNNLGLMLTKRQNYGEGMHHLRLAVQYAPDFEEAHYNLAKASEATGDLAAARRHYEAAIRLRPDFPDSYVALARTFREPEELPAALEVLREGERHVPRSPLILGDLGLIFRQAGRLDEAAAAWERALALDPGYEELSFLLQELRRRR